MTINGSSLWIPWRCISVSCQGFLCPPQLWGYQGCQSVHQRPATLHDTEGCRRYVLPFWAHHQLTCARGSNHRSVLGPCLQEPAVDSVCLVFFWDWQYLNFSELRLPQANHNICVNQWWNFNRISMFSDFFLNTEWFMLPFCQLTDQTSDHIKIGLLSFLSATDLANLLSCSDTCWHCNALCFWAMCVSWVAGLTLTLHTGSSYPQVNSRP